MGGASALGRPTFVLAGIALIAVAAASYFGFSSVSAGSFDARVRAYLLSHPEVVLEMQDALAARATARQAAALRPLLAAHHAELFQDARDGAVGPADAKATMVVFIDYQCSHCKGEAAPFVAELLQQTPNLRVVFKELPIFGAASRQAARAALGAAQQGRYFDYFRHLMASPQVNAATIDTALRDSRADLAAAHAFAGLAATDGHVDDNVRLAHTLGITGTPAFVIGDTVVLGTDEQRLRDLVNQATR